MAILYSGTEGTCQWTIDDQGHLYIGDGIIDHATSESNDWSWFRYSYHIITVSSGNVSWALGANAHGMFYDCRLLTSFDISNFNTSNVTSMFSMFNNCRLLTSLDLSNFDTSNVTDMRYMFHNCFSLASLNVSNFDTSKVTNMSYMFSGCPLTSLNLLNFDTSNVTKMTYMFSNCSLTSFDLSNFDTSKVTDMNGMFNNCSLLTAIIVSNKWTVASVTSSQDMFRNCSSLMGEQGTIYNSSHTDASYAHIDGGASNPGYLIDINSCSCYASFNSDNKELRIFMDAEGKYTEGQVIGSTTYWTDIENITGQNAPPWHNFPDDIKSVRIVNIYKPKTAYNLFAGCLNLASLDLSNLDTSNVTDMHSMFYNCRILTSLDVSNFDTSNVTDMGDMFADCQALTLLDVSNFDTGKVTSMRGMFENCCLLTSLDVSNFNTSNVANMNGMFKACSGLTFLNLSNFNTSNVINMGGMFYSCQSLTFLNLLSFDTSKVENMNSMFRYCQSLTSLDISSFDTSQVEDMARMFYVCGNLTTITMSSNFRTDQVTNMSNMFNNCQSLTSLDLSSFNTSDVINMNSMFGYCQSLTSLDISNFNTGNVNDMNEMFSNCINLTSLILPEDFASNTKLFSSVFTLDAKLTQLNITKIYLKKVEKISNTFQECPFSLNLVVGNVSLISYTSTFKDSTGTFYIIDSTKSNTSWQTVASEYNNVFYNADGAFLPAYRLNAVRGSILDGVWTNDEGGNLVQFTYNVGDIKIVSNIPEGFSCTSDTAIAVKENNTTISDGWTWENNTYTLELQEPSKAHQYVMELTYNFIDEDGNTYTKTVSQLISIAEPYALLDFRAGGRGIAIGKLSERNGFDIAFPVSIGTGLKPPVEQGYFLSTDTIWRYGKRYYQKVNDTYVLVTNIGGNPSQLGYYEYGDLENTIDLNNYQLLIGQYNIRNNEALFVIGDGTEGNPSNALVVTKNAIFIDGVANFGTRGASEDFDDEWDAYYYDPSFAIGDYSNIFGNKCVASGRYSFARGDHVLATGEGAFASGGYRATQSGDNDHFLTTFAIGDYSFAHGIDVHATGDYSSAFGYDLNAERRSQFVVGENNKPDTEGADETERGKYAFIIGNGLPAHSSSNAFTVDWNGNIMAQGMAGMIMMFGGTTEPAGWLFCDGRAVSRTTYAELFAVIDTNYGAGDGSTTFNLPDLSGKFPLGVSSGHPLNYTQTGSSGGEETHKLTTTEIPGHTHGPGTLNITASGSHAHKLTYETDAASGTAKNRVVPGNDTGSKTGSNEATKTATHTHSASNFAGATAQNTGGGGVHNNMPPYRTVNFIIATGKTS